MLEATGLLGMVGKSERGQIAIDAIYGIIVSLLLITIYIALRFDLKFAIPVIMAEGTMPIETIKRSSQVLTSKFGSNVRATLRLGVVYILLWLGVYPQPVLDTSAAVMQALHALYAPLAGAAP